MKFGAHSYIFSDRWTDDCLPILDTARELGLDCLEIGIGDDVYFTPALTRRRAEAVGLELTISPGGLWPMACNLASAEANERVAGLAWHQKQVELAGELGATAYCGSLYGHTGIVNRHPPQPDEYKHMAAGLRQLAGYGQSRGVAIVLEPMSHFRTHLINKPEQAMPLLALADHPNLALLLDTYHMVTEVRDYGAAIRTAGDKLWGVHACENDRGVPGGGLVPWDTVFAALSDIGFDGYVMMESYNSSLDDFAWQRAMFHNVCPDARAFIGQGLRFLKQGLLRSCEA
jgi:D-psicose/D-tagatose/L-ribulose 3-epimerase